MKTVNFHSTKNETWVNAAGDAVPYKYVPKNDKVKESLGAKIHKAALNAESVLKALHIQMNYAFAQIKAGLLEEFEIKKTKKQSLGKGSLTWYNFDKSLKVEADMNDIIKWDEALMAESLALFNKYLNSSLGEVDVFVRALVDKGFSNSKGQIDTGKVFQILKQEKNIKNTNFQKACQLIKQAQDVDKTKLYMRVWEKLPDGSYRNINLNFTSL